jgi:hypothetical protein
MDSGTRPVLFSLNGLQYDSHAELSSLLGQSKVVNSRPYFAPGRRHYAALCERALNGMVN